MIERRLARGGESEDLAPEHDPLRRDVLMVAPIQVYLANVHTLSVIFAQDLAEPRWRAAQCRCPRDAATLSDERTATSLDFVLKVLCIWHILSNTRL